MMKKRFSILVVFVVAFVFSVLSFMITDNLLDRENILDRITNWPDLQVDTLDGELVSTTDILGDKPVMLYYFNTECIFCQETFTDLPNHPELMKEATLLFISDEYPAVVREFIIDMGLDGVPEILFYVDSDQQMKDFFDIRGVPAIYLFNQQGELIDLYSGATALTKISNELQEEISSR